MIVILLIIGQSIMGEERDFNFIRNLFLDQSYSLVITEVKNFTDRYPESRYKDDLFYLEAESDFRLKDYGAAIRLFQRYLKLSLSSQFRDDAQLRIIQANFALGNDQQVIRWAERFPEKSPLLPEGLYFKGEAEYRHGLFKDAQQSYEQVLRAGAKGDLRAKALYSLAYTHFRLKSYDQAITLCDELIKQFPDHDLSREAHFLKARTLVRLGKKTDALDYLEFISEQNEDIAVEAKIMAGDICLKTRDFDQARTFYQRVIRYYPLHSGRDRAFLGLARTALHSGDYQAAIKAYQVFIDSFPDSPLRKTTEHELGLSFLGTGKYRLARHFLKKSRDNYHIGLSYFEEGDYPNAINYLSRLESNGRVERLIGEAYYRLKEYGLGIDHYLKAGAVIDAARGYVALGRMDDGLRILKDATDYQAILYRADIRYESRDYEGALSDYLKAYAIQKQPDPAYGAGWASFKLGDYESAIRYLSIITKEFPEWKMAGDVYLTIGDSYLNLKDHKRAIDAYGKVPSAAREHDEAVFRTGVAYLRDHDYQGAIQAFSKLASDDAVYMLGYSYFQNGGYDKAIDALSKVGNESRYYPSARQTIGDCYYNLGENDQALDVYLDLFKTQDSLLVIGAALDGINWVFERKGESECYNAVLDSLIKAEDRAWIIPELRFRLARSQIRKDTAKAFENLNLVIQDARSDSLRGQALFILTRGLFDLGRVDSAISTAGRLIQISTFHDQGGLLLVKGLYLKHDYHGMLKVLKTLKKSGPRFYYAGQADRNLGRVDLAIKDFEQAIKTNNKSEVAGASYLELARIRVAHGDYDRAVGLLRNSITTAPDSLAAQAQLLLGDVFFRKGDFKTAIVEFRRLEYLFPARANLDGQALIRIGESYERLGDLISARRTYQVTKKKYPGTRWEDLADEHLSRISH